MKFALVQPINSTATIRVIDGQFAKTTVLGNTAFVSSPSAVWEFLTGSEGWEQLEEENIRNKVYSALATMSNEFFTRMVYRVPEDVDLYTEEEIRAFLPMTLTPAAELNRYCP